MADVRPESLKRITTKEMADAFIADQIAAIKEQVGDKKSPSGSLRRRRLFSSRSTSHKSNRNQPRLRSR